ncbi:MAG: hypothetical protein MUF01_08440 [Bryobacterales bacterium]|jgi:rubrerythrin|nr:hypothetical protein [Bryobacterales bacterium]
MMVALSIGLVLVVLLYVLFIRPQDLPYVEPHSPTGHLDERKAAIYENLRDANFEFLMGKLSQEDYQATKADLQQELTQVNKEIEGVLGHTNVNSIGASVTASVTAAAGATRPKAERAATGPMAKSATALLSESASGTQRFVCANCGASFAQPMKFCGECGHRMDEARA